MAGDYEITHAIRIGTGEIVIGENLLLDLPYLVGEYHEHSFLGEYKNCVGCDTPMEMLEEFIRQLGAQVEQLRDEFIKEADQDILSQPILVGSCYPDDRSKSITSEVIVINAQVLSPEYRRETCQLYIANGGFGCGANSRGNAVFCTNLYTGKDTRFERYEVLGVIKPECLPEWIKQRLKEIQTKKESKTKAQKDQHVR